MSPSQEASVKIKATIYPGVFDSEYQVTVNVTGRDINIHVSGDFVEVGASPTPEGIEGFLKVYIVEKTDDGKFVIALPGEVQSAPSRITAERSQLQRVA